MDQGGGAKGPATWRDFFRLGLGVLLWGWFNLLGAAPLELQSLSSGQHPDAALWVDASGSADLQAAERAFAKGEFGELLGRSSFGLDERAHWFRFELKRPVGAPGTWWLQLAYPGLDDVRLFIPSEAGGPEVVHVGDHLPFAERPIINRHYVFPLKLPEDRPVVFYLRVQTRDTLSVPLTLWDPERFEQADALGNTMLGGYYGFILAMLLYNFFLFLKLRDSLYAYYLAFSGTILLAVAELNGQAFQYLWPDNLWLADRQHVIIPATALICIMLFMRRLFELPQYWPLLNRAVSLMMGWAGLSLVLGLAYDYRVGHAMILWVLPFQTFMGLAAGIQACRRGYRPARYYLASQVFFQAALVIVVFSGLGFMSSSVLGETALCVGSTLEVMMFSLALAERVSLFRQEKLDAVERAMSAEKARAEVLARSEQALKKLVAEREQALRSKEQADVANRNKSRFLATASHDLRQPIQAMRLFLSTMGKLSDPVEIKPLIGHMEHSVRSLAELLDTFLDISKLDSGSITPDWQPVSVHALIERLLSEFEVQALDAGLRLKIWEPREAVAVWSDANLLLTVMRNLLSNAIRYTRQGGLLIACRRRQGRVVLQVWDTGIGIPATEQQRVFEEFFQAGNAASGRVRGLGLGLSIVDRIARLLKASLSLRSRPERGTRFEISLPAYTAGGVSPAWSGEDGPEVSGRKSCIAVIDDDPQVLLALQLYLKSDGHRVIAAASAESAISLLQQYEWVPDLVISDYALGPGGNGCDAVVALRQSFGSQLPALIITGETAATALAHIEAAGIGYVRKPINPSVLAAQVERLLHGGEGQQGLAGEKGRGGKGGKGGVPGAEAPGLATT